MQFLTAALTCTLVAVVVAPAQGEQDRDDTLRVLTYNLHGLLDDAPSPDWDPMRISWLLDAIEQLDPDIVGFQEVLQRLRSDGYDNEVRTLADSLSRRTGKDWAFRFAVAHPSWDRFEEGIAILTSHPILSSEAFLLEAKDIFQRNLLSAHIQTPLGEVDFFATHLAHRMEAEDVRKAQVAEIGSHVGHRTETEVPAIVVGDFNAGPQQASVQLAVTSDSAASLIDAFAAVNPGVAGYTFPAEEPARRIDYVFVTERAPFHPVRAEVLFDQSIDGKMLSDHLGLVVEFVRKP